MSIILDSGFIYAFYNKDDVNHKVAVQLLNQIEHGAFGTIYLTDYIFDETMTLMLAKGGLNRAIACGKVLVNAFDFFDVSHSLFIETWKQFQHRRLSFTDCSTLVVMDHFNIDYLATFDRGFKGLVKTIGV